MRRKPVISLSILIFFISVFLAGLPLAAQNQTFDGENSLTYFLDLATQSKPVVNPPEGIYPQDEILMCTGNSEAAKACNAAAQLMLSGNYLQASTDLKTALKKAPLFFPFHYNIGICYYRLNERARAKMHLEKAKLLVPEYFLTYIQLGHLEILDGNDDNALLFYREALRKNPKYLDAIVLVGNIYLNRHQRVAASKYYEAVLALSPLFPNALLGRARVQYENGEFYKAYQTMLMIDTSNPNYDKSLHFFLAECSYQLQDYKSAYDNYTKLLQFKNDRFFITTSLRLIEHKQELSRRFVEQLE